MGLDVQTLITAFLSAGGGGAFIAFFMFRKLSEGWLDTKFAEKLEAFRHENAKDLEELRADIDGSLRARLRLQERQFDSISGIWAFLKASQEKLGTCLSPLQSYADIRLMDDAARTEYLDSFDLKGWQKNEILGALDIQKSFTLMIDRKRFWEATQAFGAFDRAIRSNELFFSEELVVKLKAIADSMNSALVDKDIALDHGDRQLSLQAWKTYDKECGPKIGEFAIFARKILTQMY